MTKHQFKEYLIKQGYKQEAFYPNRLTFDKEIRCSLGTKSFRLEKLVCGEWELVYSDKYTKAKHYRFF